MPNYQQDPIAFIDAFVTRNEKGQPFTLSTYQRKVLILAFTWTPGGQLLLGILLWSEIKKSGKTFLAACLGLWHAFVNPHTVVLVAANDMDQAVGRVFATMTALLDANEGLKHGVTIRVSEIRLSNGTTIRAVPNDYRGEAGERHSLVIYDELWAYDSERARRLFDELTIPPTEPNGWTLIVTYAGFSGESTLLEELYRRGLKGERLDDNFEVTRADDLIMFWSHVARQPWQLGEVGERYYGRQRRLLRPNTYLRLHENRWVSVESAFLTPELYDPLVDSGCTPIAGSPSSPVFVGVDGAIKRDTVAVVGVTVEDGRLRLAHHRIWRPTLSDPIDLEATVEAYLRVLRSRGHLRAVYYDPYQLHRSATTLRHAGIPMHEFPQSLQNTTRMGQALFDAVNGQTLRLYPAVDLRQQALNTVAVESARGWRIAK